MAVSFETLVSVCAELLDGAEQLTPSSERNARFAGFASLFSRVTTAYQEAETLHGLTDFHNVDERRQSFNLLRDRHRAMEALERRYETLREPITKPSANRLERPNGGRIRDLSVERILDTLPTRIGDRERLCDYFKRTEFNVEAWITFCQSNTRDLLAGGFGLISHTRAEGDNAVMLNGTYFSYIRRIR